MTFIHTAHLKVKTNFLEQFKVRVALHASLCTDLEIGCLKFDVHQEKNDPCLFFLFEIYSENNAFELHRQSNHYLQFRSDVKDWVEHRSWWYWDSIH
ncbi:MAG: hypothetical protein EBQ70_13835 [Betaproteobacteria bacterium]|jgi:quinol monooxygenase YgiN|nr:hypothetical protein [Betaproteobacteria bacterium]